MKDLGRLLVRKKAGANIRPVLRANSKELSNIEIGRLLRTKTATLKIIAENYPATTGEVGTSLYQIFPTYQAGAGSACGSSFYNAAELYIKQILFRLRKGSGILNGTKLRADLYLSNTQTANQSSAIPTGGVLASSDEYLTDNMSSTVQSEILFNFSQNFKLDAGKYYFFVIKIVTSPNTVWDATNNRFVVPVTPHLGDITKRAIMYTTGWYALYGTQMPRFRIWGS